MLPLVAAIAFAVCSGGAASWRKCAVETLSKPALRQRLTLARELARRQPVSCPAAHELGVLLEAGGHREEARLWLERARRACPDDAAILFDWGRVAHAAGCSSEAIGALTDAVLRSPEDGDARRELAAARAAEGERFSRYDRRIAEIGGDVEAASAAGRTPAPSVGDAWRHLVRSLELLDAREPGDPEIVLRLAELHRIGIDLGRAGSRGRAVELARRALDARPAWSAALVLLGTLELTAEPSRPDEAERAFLAALNAAADDEAVEAAWLGLYLVYATTGRNGEAEAIAGRQPAVRAAVASAPPTTSGRPQK